MMAAEAAAMLEVGNAPLSWGVFEGDAAGNPSWQSVLDQIDEAGYRRLELGPIGFLPEDPELLGEELSCRGLSLTGGFVYEHLHDPAEKERVLANTHRVGRMLSALGAQFLVVIDRMVLERRRTAGRGDRARRLEAREWASMIETIATVARIAAEEYGLRPVLHPHVGTHLEFPDEIDRALDELPHATIGLCVDTAHSVVAGIQPAQLVERHAERLEYFHFKDVDPLALQTMLERDLEFEEGLEIGLFCPLGQGIVDFAALRESLREISFSGSATVEQDPDPRLVDYSGLAAARESIAFLRQIGLAREEPAPADEAGGA
jgi:inosose dehydratase